MLEPTIKLSGILGSVVKTLLARIWPWLNIYIKEIGKIYKIRTFKNGLFFIVVVGRELILLSFG